MNTIKNFLGAVAIAAALLIVPVAVNAQTYTSATISTGLVSVAALSTNALIDTSKPPNQLTDRGIAKDNSWFEVPKDRGLAIQVESAGTGTNSTLIFEASIFPFSRTNWSNTRFLSINLPGGVSLTNVPASVFTNVRAVRQTQLLVTTAGTCILTNVIVGTWK